VIGGGATDAGGGPIAGGVVGVFDAAARGRRDAAACSPTVDRRRGPCLPSLRDRRAGVGDVVIAAGGVEATARRGRARRASTSAIPLAALPPSSAATIARDGRRPRGQRRASSPLAFETPPALPPIAITEVLANAAGPEPGQEYVELRNLGGDPVPLAGLRIEDSRGGDDLPSETLPGGGYALIVTSAYVAGQAGDPAPRAGTLLVRVDARIGSDGPQQRRRSGSPRAGQTLVSSYGGWVAVSSSAWSGQAVHRLDQAACDGAQAWNRTPMPPTPGAGL
jgi:hypothetical protein